MIRGALLSHLDVAQVVLYAFFAFFAGLVWYLRQEDRREGYPLESEALGGPREKGFLFIPSPKVFHRADGTTVAAPRFDRDTRPINGRKVAPWPGAPLHPTGDPMLAGIGPGSWADRADVPAKTHMGLDLIVPLRVATTFFVARDLENPIGFRVVGADGRVGGIVKDLWIDRAESLIRYHEVAVDGDPARAVLLPATFARIDFRKKRVVVDALLGAQFAAAPTTREPDRVTMREEDRITAYYGAGTLYATPARVEPLL